MLRTAVLSLCLAVSLPAPAAPAPGRVLRAHDVRFLTEAVPQLPAASWPTAGELVLKLPEMDCDVGAPISFTSEVSHLPPEMAPPGMGIPADALVELVKKNVAEDSWANDLNSIRAEGNELLIVQTPDVHDGVVRLLQALRARRARVVTVDVALVPAAALGTAADLTSPWIPAADLDPILERAGSQATRVVLTAYNEQRVSGFTGRRTSRIADHEVNQTGVIPVVNPVVDRIPMGVTVEVFPLAIADTGWFQLDLRLARVAEAGPAAQRSTFFGDLELLSLSEDSFQTTLLLEPGRAGLAGVFRAEGEGGEKRDFAVLARLQETNVQALDATPAATDETFHLRMYDVGFLIEPLGGEIALHTPEMIVKLIEADVEAEAWRDDRAALEIGPGNRLLLVTARSSTHEKVKSFLAGLLAERGRVAILETRELEGPLDDLLAARRAAEDGVFLPPGWPGAALAPRLREVFRAAGAGVLGTRLKASGFDSRRFVADYDTVSGGTGFSVVNMPDPDVESAGDGFQLEARTQATGVPGLIGIELDLDRCRTRVDKTARMILPLDIRPVAGSPAEDPKPAPVAAAPPRQIWRAFDVDLPGQLRLARQASVALPVDRPAVVRIEDAGGGRGRMMVATLRVAKALGDGPPAGAAGGRREMRLFDLRFLSGDPPVGDRMPVVPALRVQDSWEERRAGLQLHLFAPGWGLRAFEPGLIELMKDFIDPDSWRNARNDLNGEYGRIQVVQTPETLARIDPFLTLLQARAARLAALDLAMVPPAAIEKAAPGSLRPDGSPWLAGDLFEKAVAAAGEDALVFSTLAREGALLRLAPRSTSRRLGDYEVNQTGVVPAMNPVVASSLDGPFAEVAVWGAPAGAWFRADVRLGFTRLPREPERRRIVYGDLDLADLEHAELVTCAPVPAGRTVLLGLFSGPEAAEKVQGRLAAPAFVALLRVRRAAPISEPALPAESAPRPVDAGLLLVERPSAPGADDQHGGERSATDSGALDPELLEASLASLLGATPEDEKPRRARVLGGTVYVGGGDADAAKVREYLEQLARERFRAVVIDIFQANASVEELRAVGQGAVLDDALFAKVSARPPVRARVLGATASRVALASVAAREFLGDVNLVAGGSGQKLSIAADPEVQLASTGILLEAACDLVAGFPWAGLEVHGETARPPVFGRQGKARTSLGLEAQQGEVTPADEWITLDLPDEDADRLTHHVTVPIGRPVLLSALPDASSPGSVRLLVALVRDLPGAWEQ